MALSLAPTCTRWVLDDSGSVDIATRTAARVTVCIVLLGEGVSRRDTADRVDVKTDSLLRRASTRLGM